MHLAPKKSFGFVQIASGSSIGTGDTSIPLTSGHGARLSVPTAGRRETYYPLTFLSTTRPHVADAFYQTPKLAETVLVTANSGDSLTVEREFDNTTALAMDGNWIAFQTISEPDWIAVDPGWFNVKDPRYSGGATGDGVTDDSAAIQATINACAAAGGGTVFFPIGAYLCSGLTLTADNVQFRGRHRALSYLLQDGTTDVLSTTGAANLEMVDIGFQSTTASGWLLDAVGAGGSHRYTRCSFSKPATSDGLVRLDSTIASVFNGCVWGSVRNGGTSLRLQNGCFNTKLYGCRFDGTIIDLGGGSFTHEGIGIDIKTSDVHFDGILQSFSQACIIRNDADHIRIRCYAESNIQTVLIENTLHRDIWIDGFFNEASATSVSDIRVEGGNSVKISGDFAGKSHSANAPIQLSGASVAEVEIKDAVLRSDATDTAIITPTPTNLRNRYFFEGHTIFGILDNTSMNEGDVRAQRYSIRRDAGIPTFAGQYHSLFSDENNNDDLPTWQCSDNIARPAFGGGFSVGGDATISSGVLDINRTNIISVVGESNPDDLDSITDAVPGFIAIVLSGSSPGSVTVKHSASIVLQGAADYTLSGTGHWIFLVWDGTRAVEVGRRTP